MLPEIDIATARAGLAEMFGLRVAVIGETILDEYAFCDAIGKSGKEPMLVTRFSRCEVQAGGVLAIANHLAEFCRDVEVVSVLGGRDSREDFVRSSLAPQVRGSFVRKAEGQTIVKRRYMDAYSHAKMLGVYRLDASELEGEDLAAMQQAVETAVARADVVIVADYGHGVLAKPVIEQLCGTAAFLAVNTQLNAANNGYNVLSKYPRADYACLHEGELRLDARDRTGDLRELMVQARERIGARALTVTLGKHGTWINTPTGDHRCPALASNVVERVGAGDAVLALSSLAIAAGLHPDLVGVLANLAGAQVVAQLGNHVAIRKAALVGGLVNFAARARRAG